MARCAIGAGSWCRSSRRIQQDDRCRKLRSVESLNAAGQSLQVAEVDRVVDECSWTIVAVRSWCWQLGRVESSERGD